MEKSTRERLPRLSAKEEIILELLMPGSEKYGLQLMREAHGELKRGTIYVTLHRMEEKGLVDSRPEEKAPDASGIPRRLYRINGFGQRVLNAHQSARAMVFATEVPA
jgi:DNA-binding PadR family transcriptional regulator